CELLVQTRRKKDNSLVQVVPDNMVVLTEKPLRIGLSYNVPIQPVGPFWVLEYVSQNNPRKDYQQSLPKYEKDLKVPYCLIFHPDEQELMLLRHPGRRFVSVKPDQRGRYAIPELELELAIVDGWVRYWFRGRLLGLPADLQRELDEARRDLNATRRDKQQLQERAARLAELALKLQQGTLSPAE